MELMIPLDPFLLDDVYEILWSSSEGTTFPFSRIVYASRLVRKLDCA